MSVTHVRIFFLSYCAAANRENGGLYLASPVCRKLVVFDSILPCYRVPHGLVVEFQMVRGIGDSSERRGDDHSFHRRSVGFDGFQDSSCALDSGFQNFGDWICKVVVKWRRGVNHVIKGRSRFESLSERQRRY